MHEDAYLNQPIKWHGGKAYLAKKIIGLMPSRDTWHLYREPFAGGLSVLLHLDPEGLSEAVNDLSKDLTNFWRVLRYDFLAFQKLVENCPFCEQIWSEARDYIEGFPDEPTDSYAPRPVNRAAAFFVLARQSRQGLMKDFATPTQRLRRGMNENVSAWLSAVEGLPEAHERLKRVEIRNMDAVDFIEKYDNPRAVFYCDPPYLQSTRTAKDCYQHEMSEEQHERLLECLTKLKGWFLLSGYDNPLYEHYAEAFGWFRTDFEIDNKAGSGKKKQKRVESVWMNYPPVTASGE